MLKNRIFEVILVSKEKNQGIDFNIKPDKVIKYNGKKQVVKF